METFNIPAQHVRTSEKIIDTVEIHNQKQISSVIIPYNFSNDLQKPQQDDDNNEEEMNNEEEIDVGNEVEKVRFFFNKMILRNNLQIIIILRNM